MAIFGSSGPKKPINWATTGAILFVIATVSIYVADNVFNVSFIPFLVFLLIAAVGVVLFVVFRISKTLNSGQPMNIGDFVLILFILGIVVVAYWKFPQLMPSASDFSMGLKSALGGP